METHDICHLSACRCEKVTFKNTLGKHENPQSGSYGRPQTGVPVCQRRCLALLQTDPSDNQLFLCSREGPVGENKPAHSSTQSQKQCFRCVHRAHLQYFFILQDAGDTIPKGHGPKQQDVKQVHLLFSGNLDKQRPV